MLFAQPNPPSAPSDDPAGTAHRPQRPHRDHLKLRMLRRDALCRTPRVSYRIMCVLLLWVIYDI